MTARRSDDVQGFAQAVAKMQEQWLREAAKAWRAGQPLPMPAGELTRRARAVVDARCKPGGEWEELKDAIAELAGLVGGGDLA